VDDVAVEVLPAGAARGGRVAVDIRRGGEPVGDGVWFTGDSTAGLAAWADVRLGDLAVVDALVRALGPGASLMVSYGGGDPTERALRRRVPPAATPLGRAMLDAGCRWFKDWYFAEGGREGSPKLQGTVPRDEAAERRAAALVAAEQSAYTRSGARAEDVEAARDALTALGPGRP
jgi:hypothetical protein